MLLARPAASASAALLAALAACARPQPTSPDAAPPPTDRPVLLVANKLEATVSVHELPEGRVLATLPTGAGPHEIAVSPDGARAVVSDYGGQLELGRTLTVIDVPALAVIATIDLGEYRRPHGIAFLPDGRRVAVTSETHASVLIVDVDAGAVERAIPTAQAGTHMLALTADGTRAYTANIGAGTVTELDLVAGTGGAAVPAVPACEGIAVTPNGEVWTASLTTDEIAILATPGLTRAGQLAGLGAPIRLTATPDGAAVLIANVEGSALQLVDVASRRVDTIAVPPRAGAGATAAPVGTTFSPDSRTAYVALVTEDRVAIVDLPTRAITGHVATGRGPDGVGYSTAFVR